MKNQKVSIEIVSMAQADQHMRKMSQSGKQKFNKDIDKYNSEHLKQIIHQLGNWPTIPLVGLEASYASWLIVQHSDHDVDFQEACLALMKNNEQDVLPQNIAYLEDRVAVNRGRSQIYGTQFYQNKRGELVSRRVKNLKGLQERRQKMGLEPYSLYLQKMRGEYQWPENYQNPKIGRFDKSP